MRMTWRDKLVANLVNLVFRFATREYRMFIEGAINYGMRSAARDELGGLPAPPALDELRQRVAGGRQ